MESKGFQVNSYMKQNLLKDKTALLVVITLCFTLQFCVFDVRKFYQIEIILNNKCIARQTLNTEV